MVFSVLSIAAAFVIVTAVLTRILMRTVVLGMVAENRIWDSLETDENMAVCE